MSIRVMLITVLLPGSMAEEIFSLKLTDLEKNAEQKTANMLDKQFKRIDVPNAYHYPVEQTTHGIGYGHYLHPFYYQGKTTAYDCALQDEWHPIIPAPELDFGVNEDNAIRNQPLLNPKYNEYSKPFPNYWKDMLYNSEFLDENARAYISNNYSPQEIELQKQTLESHQSKANNTINTNTKPVLEHNKEITTYLTPPPFSVNANWRNIFNVPHENNNNPGKMMDLITALHNFKIIPILEEEDDDIL